MARDTGSPEWVIMYRQGLTPRRIADLCHVRVQQVNRAISRAQAREPGIEDEHLRNTPSGMPAITPQWAARCRELQEFITMNGRPPFSKGQGPEESSLGRWLEKQRGFLGKGLLPEGKLRALDAAGEWRAPARAHVDLRRWEERLQELAAFVAAESRFPSYRTASSDRERVLGTWLHTQRQRLARGEMSPGQLQSLQETVAGWNTRRNTGRS